VLSERFDDEVGGSMTNELSASAGRVASEPALTLRLDAFAENLMLVRQAVDGAAREIGASQAVIDDLKLAVTEACSNVVRYAYRGRPGELSVEFEPLDGGFAVRVSDRGTWLDRDGEAEAGGLGIPLMEAVTRSFEIATDGAGTQVRLEFPLEADDARAEAVPGE
jgi:serine/threonine-protein kinase RsbW